MQVLLSGTRNSNTEPLINARCLPVIAYEPLDPGTGRVLITGVSVSLGHLIGSTYMYWNARSALPSALKTRFLPSGICSLGRKQTRGDICGFRFPSACAPSSAEQPLRSDFLRGSSLQDAVCT